MQKVVQLAGSYNMAVPPWIKTIVIEPYIFLMSMTIGMSLLPLEQLQQDKICRIEFNQTLDYCLKMSESSTSEVKLAILARSNNFGQFKTIIDAVPGMFWCLIAGSVADRYPKTRKPFMIATALSGLVRDSALLLNLFNFYNWGNYCNLVLRLMCSMLINFRAKRTTDISRSSNFCRIFLGWNHTVVNLRSHSYIKVDESHQIFNSGMLNVLGTSFR